MTKATIKARNELFRIIECVKRGQSVGLNNPKLLAAARELDSEGLIKLHDNFVCERMF